MEDNKQYKAINHGKGPALVLAGPGSGKTLVLTHHIYSLIKKGADPNKILVITFTKSAAKQMYDRFKKLSPSSANKVFFGTFHSFFYRMIKDLSNISKTIISENERNKILSTILGSKELCEVYSNKISLYKSLFNKDDFDFEDLNKEYFLSVYNSYNELMLENNKIDFDDITSLFYEKIILNDINLKRIGSLFDYVCIDEFQDINMYQYECIKKAFMEKGNIYCVGDFFPTPSIYSRIRGSYTKPHYSRLFSISGDFKQVRLSGLNGGSYPIKRENLSNLHPIF